MAFNQYSLDLELSSSQYVYVADNAELSITGDISIEAWVKLEQLPSTAYYTILSKYDTGSDKRSYLFSIKDDKLGIWYSQDGTEAGMTYLRSQVAWTSADVGKWIHVAVSTDVSAKTCVFYKNGASEAYDTINSGATSVYDSAINFNIGAFFVSASIYSASYFDGKLNNVRLWSDIRTESEVQDNRFLTLTGTSNNLVGSWYSTANNHEDLAGTNDLTASGSPVIVTDVPWTGANSTDWTSAEIKSDNTKVSGSSDLTDYPTLIADGNLTSAVYAGLETDGKDLRITTDSAGTTEIPFEIVAMDTSAETCEIWAKVPTLEYDADTSLFIWYGNASAVAYAADDTFGSQNVWTSNYKLVHHAVDGFYGSTSNGNNGVNSSASITASGKIGVAYDFDNDDYIYAPHDASLSYGTGDFFAQFWMKTSEASYEWAFSKGDGGAQGRFTIGVNTTLQAEIGDGSNTVAKSMGTTINTGSWFKITVNYDRSGNVEAFINGVSDGTESITSVGSVTNTSRVGISAAINNADTANAGLTAIIDEARTGTGLINVDWDLTEYNNQNSPSTFWTPVSGGRRVFLIS